jgi:hypothetical protein
MKNLLILSVLISVLIAGCMTDNLVTEGPPAVDGQKLVWLTFSDNGPMRTETEVVISKVINGNSGGKIIINEVLGKVEITGTLTVPAGGYPGNQNISVTLNDNFLYQIYKPSPYVFRNALILNLTYKNIDLSATEVKKVGFYFLSENGNYYRAECDSQIYDTENRTIGIVGAKIPHFSRWGWAKVEDE